MYHPPKEILEKYADILVRFALNSGEGVKKGEVVSLEVPECAKPLLIELQKSVLRAGGHYITHFIPDEISRHFYENAEDHQLEFFPEKLLRGRVDEIDHHLVILAETNKKELEGISPEKIMRRQKAWKPYREWRDKKENEGKFTWTLALYGTPAAALEAGISEEEYWEQIIKACYLDEGDTIAKWKWFFTEIERIKSKLDSMDIERVHIKGDNVDLNVKIGKNRKWLGGSGRNIPSFELFISPDWRGTEGFVKCDMPLYRYGSIVKGIYLEFEQGKVVKSSAEQGENVLKEMIKSENADKIGEFSLTDKRFSKIDKFMAETLFDENFGGEYGNFHIALGSAYKDSYPGDASKVTKEQWESMGYNESVVHTDVVYTGNRVVTAYFSDGSSRVIYENGQFVI